VKIRLKKKSIVKVGDVFIRNPQNFVNIHYQEFLIDSINSRKKTAVILNLTNDNSIANNHCSLEILEKSIIERKFIVIKTKLVK